MDSRMDLSALERSRLLSSLPSSALGHLGLSALAVSEQSHSSALNRLSAASAAAAAAAAGASPPDLARAGSPTAGLTQYPGRYMSSSALHSPGTSYAMMAGYFGGSSHIPDSFKALMPEFQQYWGTSQEAYARQMLATMYYPYLPYLPATESLSLFAQNSATAAQVQAAAQAHAAHHRIYDLHKEALFGSGAIPGNFYPQSLLLPTQSSSQVEATNLSISGSSKSKQKDEKDKHKHLETESNKICENTKTTDSNGRLSEDDRTPTSDGSERTRGMSMKKTSDDQMKFRSNDGVKKSSATNATTNSYSASKNEHDRKRSKLEAALRQAKENCDEQNMSKSRNYRNETQTSDKKRIDKLSSPVPYSEPFVPISAFSPIRSAAFHSPPRNDRVISPDRRSSKAYSPIRSQKASSPLHLSDNCQPVQDKPENLCVKDRKYITKDIANTEKHKTVVSNTDTVTVKTQSIVTGTTITVTSTLNVITSDLSLPNQKKVGRDTDSSPRQLSPALSSPSSGTTSTTYSLPYYHNLYSRSQSNSQDGKKIHAVTYVPEIGTIPSPFAISPPMIDSKITPKSESEHKSYYKYQSNNDGSIVGDLSTDKTDDRNLNSIVDKPSPPHLKSDIKSKEEEFEKEVEPCKDRKANEKDRTNSEVVPRELLSVKSSEHSCQKQEKACVQQSCLETLKRRKSVSPVPSSSTAKSIDLTTDNDGDANKSSCNSPKSQDILTLENKSDKKKRDSDGLNKTSAIVNKTSSCSSKVSEPTCDMNHNSKSAAATSVKNSDSKSISKPQLTEIANKRDHSNKVDLTEPNKTRRSSKENSEKCFPDKASDTAEPENEIKKSDKGDSGKGSSKEEKLQKSKETDKGQAKEKRDLNHMSGSTIPVGIAVARQRNIAPKTDKDPPKTDEVRGKVAAAEIKPVRPLKIIRPSSKGKTAGATEFRNELPANLIVTGGNNNNSNLFWGNDQASRQLAAQYLQTGAQLNQTSWYDPSHLTFPHVSQPATSDGTQMPLSIPPGFKLAQDSLTGGILFIPSGTDVYDSSRIFSSFPVGAPNTQTFGHSLLTSPQTQSSIPTAGAAFINQSTLNGSSHFHAPFGTDVLPRPEVPVKEEKLEINTGHNTDPIITSSVGLTPGRDNGSISVIVHQDIDKDKIMTVPPPSFVTDLSLTAGQQCAYTFHPPAMPYIFNPSVLPVHNIPEPSTEVTQTKLEHTSVQSRGTSPMLPATDSSNEETEDCSSQHEEKCEKLDEKADELINENDGSVCKSLCEEPVTSDFKEEIASELVPENDLNVVSEVESTNMVAEVKTETVFIDDKSNDLVCDKTSCDNSEHKNKELSNILESQTMKPGPVREIMSGVPEKETNLSKISQKSIDTTESGTEKEVKMKSFRTLKSDRNIFSDLTEYNPFTDPQLLEATDGLELLSTLAEKSSLCSQIIPTETILSETPKGDAIKEDVYAFKEDKISTSKSFSQKTNIETIEKPQNDIKKQTKSRIKCGYAFKPTKTPETLQTSPVRMTTFCGITIPEDDDVIDSIEMEMKMRLVELQKRYKEKQKELIRLKPKKEKEKGKEEEKEKEISTETIEKTTDAKRGRGRPKKRKHEGEENSAVNSASQSPKSKATKRDDVSTPVKILHTGRHSKSHSSQHTNSAHGTQNSNGGSHGSNKKKKLAEMLVDRVFRKAGSSFKIPLSKKISLIAPARIELPGPTSNNTDKTDPNQVKKSLDIRGLIKDSRLSQLNGNDRSFDGGLWKRKEEKRKEEEKKKHSQPLSVEEKPNQEKKNQEVDNGLGLLAEYATKYQEVKDNEKEKTDKIKKKRKNEEESSLSSPESPNKKRKPGRPKKCDLTRPGVTETIVAKQSKHMDFFRLQKEDKPERKITLEGKTPLKPLYLDEWNVRRSERIFLSDSSPQTSPNNTSPGAKQKPADEKDKPKDKDKGKDKDNGKEKDKRKEKDRRKNNNKQISESGKKQKSTNLQDISQKLKKKYSTKFKKKSKDKTTELLKARDKLTKKRHTNKLKKLSKNDNKEGAESDASTDDLPLIALKNETPEKGFPSCIIDKDELQDGLRILIFMDGLFHEGELKAIRPPDVYGAILDNERRTRPHICSQEEILRDAIKDVRPPFIKQLKEGTRICAYWSQQFSCLYPGTVSKASPDPHADKSLVNVEFDDGDTGKIPIDHIRLIPQDFPIVEYDPHPLLLLTKRRRTLSTSESSEPRISCSNIPPSPKENKSTAKRGPGRPPKADRLISEESMGDEDVFTNGTVAEEKADVEDDSKSETSEKGSPKKKNKQTVPANPPRQLWKWSGSSTKRPGLKGKARKEYYKCIVRGRETISVGECAVFLSTGRPNLPYVGRIESLWESWGGQMVVKVKWFYHPEETKGGRRLQNMKGALFRSDHEDENDVQTISHKCEVLKYEEFRRRKAVISLDENSDVYYLAGSYQPTIGHIKFEPGVI